MTTKRRTLSLRSILLAGLSLGFVAGDQPASAQTSAAVGASRKVDDRYAKFNGARIHYQNYGKGSSALVFVHGWSCNLTFWDANATAFSARHRVIAIDLLGHGQSDKPETTYSMDLFADSVEAVLKHAGVKRAVLVGHSMGAPVVRQFYRRYPKQTISLVLVDGSLKSFGTPQQWGPLIAGFKSPNYKLTVEQFVGNLTQTITVPSTLSHIKSGMSSTPQHVIVGAMEAMLDPGIWKEDPINVPVFAIYAAGQYWTPEYFQYVRSFVPDFEEQVWEGVSHFLMMDEPAKFNLALAEFLAKKNLLK